MTKHLFLALGLLFSISFSGDAEAESIRDLLKKATSKPKASTTLADGTEWSNVPMLSGTKLNRLFLEHPYDGSAASEWPRVSIRVIDWSRSDCWVASAVIWWSDQQHEAVPPHKVCPSGSLRAAMDGAVGLHHFFGKGAIDHTGNVRTDGPRPPMFAVPKQTPLPYAAEQAFPEFIQQWIAETGWQTGTSEMQVWVVGFGPSSEFLQSSPSRGGSQYGSTPAPQTVSTTQADKCAIGSFTPESYDSIKNGMKFEDVNAIMRCKPTGFLTQRGPTHTSYNWTADANGMVAAYRIMVTFDANGHVAAKNAIGF